MFLTWGLRHMAFGKGCSRNWYRKAPDTPNGLPCFSRFLQTKLHITQTCQYSGGRRGTCSATACLRRVGRASTVGRRAAGLGLFGTYGSDGRKAQMARPSTWRRCYASPAAGQCQSYCSEAQADRHGHTRVPTHTRTHTHTHTGTQSSATAHVHEPMPRCGREI